MPQITDIEMNSNQPLRVMLPPALGVVEERLFSILSHQHID
jgi:hypothetical protein